MRQDDRGFRSNRIAPVNVGDELDVKIEAVKVKDGESVASNQELLKFAVST